MKQYIYTLSLYTHTEPSHIHTSSLQKTPRLLLFFAGWGMDEHPFLQYAPPDSDFMICYDYRTLDFDTSPLAGYTVIDVVAWSMGVWAASQVLSKVSLPIRRRIAINGSPFPIDEKRGIPPAIFMGTLEGLNEASLRKFQRRMCADGNVFARFQLTAPERSIEELKEELKKYDTDEIFVIGGESIYRMLEPLCDEAFITKIDHSYQADAHFPNLDADSSWVLKEESEENTCFDLEYVFTRYERE